jgi:large subunit ribosomal protein L32e
MAKDETPAKPARPVKAADEKSKPRAEKPAAPKAAEKSAKADELKLEAAAEDEGEASAREGRDEAGPAPAKAAKDEAVKKPRGKRGAKPVAQKGRPRPTLDAATTEALAQRKAKNAARPPFNRQEWFRYQRLGRKWRAPQGIQSKMRRHWGTHADVVSIGYRGPKAARGLHPSGFAEVLIHNAAGLEGIDPARQAVRIAGSVGARKRREIQDGAKKLGIRVLNWRQI